MIQIDQRIPQETNVKQKWIEPKIKSCGRNIYLWWLNTKKNQNLNLETKQYAFLLLFSCIRRCNRCRVKWLLFKLRWSHEIIDFRMSIQPLDETTNANANPWLPPEDSVGKFSYNLYIDTTQYKTERNGILIFVRDLKFSKLRNLGVWWEQCDEGFFTMSSLPTEISPFSNIMQPWSNSFA